MKRSGRFFVLLCAVFTVLCAVASSAAENAAIFAAIEGAKQGKFKGESALANHTEHIAVLDFSYALEFVSGKRQHGPITITKALGAASPQLFQAQVTREQLKTVEIQFVNSDGKGTDSAYYTIRLTNAVVSAIRQHCMPKSADNAAIVAEDVSFTFQRIEVQSKTGKTMAFDDATK